MKCKVKELLIAGNHTIGENEQLYSMLCDPCNALAKLYMNNIELSSRAAIALFNALKDNNKLKELYIDRNDIDDDARDAITTALEKNSCLVRLIMHHNPLTSEAIVSIVNGLQLNNTLEFLCLPYCSGIRSINSLQETINKNRESRGYQAKLMIDYI